MKFRISIFEYNDYRKYLQDIYSQSKSRDPKYSYRFFAKAAGYKSASAFLDVVTGKKNLSRDGIQKFAQALRLSLEEAAFFKALVLLNQAGSAEEKLRHAKEISKIRLTKRIALLNELQYRLFEHWYYTAVLELVTLPGFSEEPGWIADHVIPSITPQQAARALEQLLALGLLTRDEKGTLVQMDTNVSTPDEVSSVFLKNWHRECMMRAIECMETVPGDKRDISGVYFSFSQENMKSVKELIHKFRRSILELAERDSRKDAVYQLNLQLFPVAFSRTEEVS